MQFTVGFTCELMAAYSSNISLCKVFQVVQKYPNFCFPLCLCVCVCTPHLPRLVFLCHESSCDKWLCQSWGHATLVHHPVISLIISSQLGGLQWLSFPQLWSSSIWTFESIPNPLSTSFDAAVPEQQHRGN